MGGLTFRRQHPIGAYVVDFICIPVKLIIEVDGGIHDLQREDAARTAWLEEQGYRVVRFSNERVLHELDGVLGEILKVYEEKKI